MSIVTAGVEPAKQLDVQETLAQDANKVANTTAVFKIVLEGQALQPTETLDFPKIPRSEDDDATLHGSIHDALCDWSGTGRGTHVHFERGEKVPLVEGRYLGWGSFGWVCETTVRGYDLAWKRIGCQQPVVLDKREEIEILKKVRHKHVVQLVGAYVHQNILGILMYPAAVCDLAVFFKAVEAHSKGCANETQNSQLAELGLTSASNSPGKISIVYSQIGCLVSAVAYLHEQKVRHKDLKPSNILLCRNQIYLSDFGTATDFSLFSQSATDNTRGTPIYFAPEVHREEGAGRAADIFSLGCVLLEILVVHSEGNLDRLPLNRLDDRTYQANLHEIDIWLPWQDELSPRRYHLIREVRAMLSEKQARRPTAQKLLRRLELCDEMMENASYSIFGKCCRKTCISTSQHDEQMNAMQERVLDLESQLNASTAEITASKDQLHTVDDRLQTAQNQLKEWEERNASTVGAVEALELAQKKTERILERNDLAYEHLQEAYRKEKDAHSKSVAELKDEIARLTRLDENRSAQTPTAESVISLHQLAESEERHEPASDIQNVPLQSKVPDNPQLQTELTKDGHPPETPTQAKRAPNKASEGGQASLDILLLKKDYAKYAIQLVEQKSRDVLIDSHESSSEMPKPAKKVFPSPPQPQYLPSKPEQKPKILAATSRSASSLPLLLPPPPPSTPTQTSTTKQVDLVKKTSPGSTAPSLSYTSIPWKSPYVRTLSGGRPVVADIQPPQHQPRPTFRGDQRSAAVKTRPLYTSPVPVKQSLTSRLIRRAFGKKTAKEEMKATDVRKRYIVLPSQPLPPEGYEHHSSVVSKSPSSGQT